MNMPFHGRTDYRPSLRRKLRALIAHPGTEPSLKEAARRKFVQLFPDESVAQIEVRLVIDAGTYPFPDARWHQTYIVVGDGFERRSVSYYDIVQAAADCERLTFYQGKRVIVADYRRLMAEDAIAAQFASLNLDCHVRHTGGFIENFRYQVSL